MLENRSGRPAIVGARRDDARLTAAARQRLVLAQVHPVGWSIDAAAHQLDLNVVPGGQIVVVHAGNRYLQRTLEHHLQITLVDAGGYSAGQFDEENDEQQKGILWCAWIRFVWLLV